MYHLLKDQQKPHICQGVYYPLNENREPEPRATDPEPGSHPGTEAGNTQERKREPETEAKTGNTQGQTGEPETEVGATQEEPEPVYTVIGEPIISAEEAEVTTIVLDLHSAPFDDQQDEEADAGEQDHWPAHPPMRRRLAPVGWTFVGMALVLVGVLVVTLVIPGLRPRPP